MQNFGDSLCKLFRSVRDLIDENQTVQHKSIPEFTNKTVSRTRYIEDHSVYDHNSPACHGTDTHFDTDFSITDVVNLNDSILSPETIIACRASIQQLSYHIERFQNFNSGSFGQMAFLLSQPLLERWMTNNLSTFVESARSNKLSKSGSPE